MIKNVDRGTRKMRFSVSQEGRDLGLFTDLDGDRKVLIGFSSSKVIERETLITMLCKNAC